MAKGKGTAPAASTADDPGAQLADLAARVVQLEAEVTVIKAALGAAGFPCELPPAPLPPAPAPTAGEDPGVIPPGDGVD